MIALTVVVVLLGISYANSVRIYFSQEAEITSLRQEARQRELSIGDLNYQLARWQDENYVRTMARERLGWVVPGEVGFRVIGADGEAIGATIETEGRTPPAEQPVEIAWWQELSESIRAADHPVAPPADEEPEERAPMTVDGEEPKELVGGGG